MTDLSFRKAVSSDILGGEKERKEKSAFSLERTRAELNDLYSTKSLPLYIANFK
jgi:hypothetical protein